MVVANGGTMTILKARFGSDVRKTQLHHANDLTLNDLVLMIQRIFSISSSENIILKYKDGEGDFITLGDDSDLLLALHEDSKLNIEVSIGSASVNVAEIQSLLQKIQTDVSSLAQALAAVRVQDSDEAPVLPPVKAVEPPIAHLNHLSNGAPPSPVPSEKSELPATIQPSVQEVVSHEDLTSSREVSAPLEDEIPLDHTYQQQDQFAPPVPDPHVHQHYPPSAPPASSIPSFPQANMPPPQPEPPAFSRPPQSSSSSVASTPLPQPNPQQFNPPAPNQGYPPSSQAPPPPISAQQQQAPPQSQFGPPQGLGHPHSGYGGPLQHQPPPMQFGQPPQQPNQPAPPGHPGFAPPTSQGFAPISQPSQQGFAPPPPSGGPGAPPQGHPSFGPPPTTYGGPQQFAPPPTEPAPPQHQQFAPGPGGPPPPQGPGAFAPPPMGGPPMGGVPGVNPFARPPGANFRQSPYMHQ